ncbi:MAG: glycosyltransferase family 2 protein [Burkholderiales bacterium]
MVESGAPRAAVIIVNFNSGALLARCLTALAAQTFRDFRTIVVDNASTDGSAHVLESRFPGTMVLRSEKNLGFAAGNNLGLATATGCKWIALLNPDAFPAPDWLEKFIGTAEAQPRFSFFGCRMRRADAPGLLDGTGDVYHVSGASWRRDHGVSAERGTIAPGEIFGPCAAAALYSLDALKDVGGFDERYFCYHEDVDLAFRLRLRGHRCRYVPEAVVDHVGSAIAGRRSDFATYHGHRNLVWTYVKDMPAPLFWLYLPLHLLANLAAIAVCAARGQFGVILRAKRDALRALPAMLAERRRIQGARVVGARELRAVMAKGFCALWSRSAS